MKKPILIICLLLVAAISSNAQEIFDAIQNGDLARVKEFVEKDPELVKRAGNNRFTPLLFATNNNKSEIAEYLISKGACVDEVFMADYYGNTPISFSIRNDNLELVKFLHEKGADIQFRTKLGENYLHFAAAQNRVDIAEYLINCGIGINSVKNGDLTPLHIAAITGSLDVAKLLVARGAKLDMKSKDGGTPLHFAIATRNNEIANILRNNGARDYPRGFPVYKGKYLGQQAPGEDPVLFVPELFRDIYRSYGAPAFSPDGKEHFFYGYFMPGVGYSRIWWMREENGIWTSPELATFSNHTSWDPAFSSDGKRLYFASRIPEGGEPVTANDLWYAEKEGEKWSEPKNPGFPPNRKNFNEMDPQLSNDGSIYFKAFGPGSGGTGMYKSEYSNGVFSDPMSLDSIIDSGTVDDCTGIEHIITYNYGGSGGAEISICFHKPDGTWTRPVYMGDKVHQGQGTSGGRVSHDGKYFFFVQNISPYWVDAKIIEELKPQGIEK